MRTLAYLWILIILTGCSTVAVEKYENTSPEIQIEEYFQGKSVARGVFQDRFGNVRRTFFVDIEGTWDEETQTLTLVEDFLYNDGVTEQRIWTIKKTGKNTYTGTAGGVVGQAKGESAGKAFNFKYTFDLPVDGSIWRVTFDDWMYQLDNKTVFNKATIRRYGIWLGDVYITFEKK